VKRLLGNALQNLPPLIRKEALTHVSYRNERGGGPDNERLEFLGDAVLHLAVGDMLFRRHPEFGEGDLTRGRAALVSGAMLASIATQAGLGDLLYLGKGEDGSGGRERPRILGSALEAVIGAVYLEHGFQEAESLVRDLLGRFEQGAVPADPKTQAQELVQRQPGSVLTYEVASVEGPDHSPIYTVNCIVDGKVRGIGRGGTKKEAEERAAQAFLGLTEPSRSW